MIFFSINKVLQSNNDEDLHSAAVLVTDTDSTSPFQCLIKASRTFKCVAKESWLRDSCSLSFIRSERLSNAARDQRSN